MRGVEYVVYRYYYKEALMNKHYDDAKRFFEQMIKALRDE